LQVLIPAFSQISLNQKGNLRNGISFLIACSAPSALCYAILAISPKSVIPSGAKFESKTSYLLSMRFLNFMRRANPFEPSELKEVATHSSLFS
ncbi:MAG: hypothetical protein MR969_06565, partial [Dialister sp.]|nr:hypothetical protein [Dialister sp.]